MENLNTRSCNCQLDKLVGGFFSEHLVFFRDCENVRNDQGREGLLHIKQLYNLH